jgi:hypothetical protein
MNPRDQPSSDLFAPADAPDHDDLEAGRVSRLTVAERERERADVHGGVIVGSCPSPRRAS